MFHIKKRILTYAADFILSRIVFEHLRLSIFHGDFFLVVKHEDCQYTPPHEYGCTRSCEI